MSDSRILDRISLPSGIKKLNKDEILKLCDEIRNEILDKVSVTGGHLASNMGAVELTVALHYVFDSPKDSIVWDVGHQCYAHKILTGRDITGIRTENGLSGFPKSNESVHDKFVAGHASTSVSAALGIAEAKRIKGDDSSVIAVIGDGAFSGGMVYEAINNAGRSDTNLIIILNDNEMSISKNVGAMANYLSKIRNKESYFRFKDCTEKVLKAIPLIGKGLFKFANYIKTELKDYYYGSNIFEHFGFKYLGPVDGHDPMMLIGVLKHAKNLKKPVVVHVNTVKGKGYPYAEQYPSKFHGIAPFYKENGELRKTPSMSYSEAFGEYLTEFAEKDNKICAITAAMSDGTGLNPFATKFPDRFFDVGIAEEHAMTFAAGLASEGMKPVFAVYSTFLQRAYDQMVHDVSIEPKHVVLGIDRAGLVGGDGETHQGIFDIPILTSIPGVTIYSPSCFDELHDDMEKALEADGLVAVRYPRAGEPEKKLDYKGYKDFRICENHSDTAIVCYGRMVNEAILYSEKKEADIIALNKVFPFPQDAIKESLKYKKIIFAEESVEFGSIAEHFGNELRKNGYNGKFVTRNVNGFVSQMSVQNAFKQNKLDSESLLTIE